MRRTTAYGSSNQRRRSLWFAAALAPLSACTGDILAVPRSELIVLSAPDDTARADGGIPAAGSGGSTAPSCAGTAVAAPAPLARLTNLEYRNTLRALLPDITMPDTSLPSDIVVEGFDNNAKAQTASATLIEQYQASAQAVAAAVVADLDHALPCAAEEAGCGAQFIDQFVSRAYRHPLSSEERSRYNALFDAARSSYDFPTAVGMVVEAALQSPRFLYRVELGGPARNGAAPLDGYELASRLSYFLWDTMPDAALLAAAESGKLTTAADVKREAERMLDDPRAHAAVANLFRQWLRFDKMDRMEKSAELFPSWNAQVAESLRSGTTQFVDHVFWELDGSLRTLLTANLSYVDRNTAAIYGVAAPSGSGLQLTTTDATQRSGILTQAGLLAAFAHETTDSPVLRGVFVLDRLLCVPPPPPPPEVTGSIIESATATGPMTTRQRVALTHEQGTCAACHRSIDGVGFSFSHYDAIGRWRTTDNGLPVDDSGWLVRAGGAETPFEGAVELGQQLADSTQVRECVASQWYRYSLGLGAKDVAACALDPIAAAFTKSGSNLQELMIATVTSDAFRNRPEVTQ